MVCLAETESWLSEHPAEEVTALAVDRESRESNRADVKGKQPLRGPFVPTIEQVHEAFDWVKAIRYNQPLHLGGMLSHDHPHTDVLLRLRKGELAHLLLTPFPSGHVLGGTLFKIRSPTSGTVLYAVGMNHTGERHLDGMVGGQGGASGYAEGVMRPDLLIVEGGRSQVVNPKRRDRESALLGSFCAHPLSTAK